MLRGSLHTDLLRRRYGILLSLLTFLFVLRVLGQVLVAFFGIDFLPAMEHWYSGLLPYPILLPIQIVMIIVLIRIIRDVTRGSRIFSIAKRGIGIFLKWFSYLYFLSMLMRYMYTMAGHPELRWFGHTIPIWFHMVLAIFLYTYSHYHIVFSRGQGEQVEQGPRP